MSKFFSAYCTLISSPAQIAQCREAKSLPELLKKIKLLWNSSELSDNELLIELNQLNQQIIDDCVQLAGWWLPHRYNANSQSICWCLPSGHATEPFQDQYISRCHQQILLNTVLQPRTTLTYLSSQASQFTKLQPAGFIFHLSRCGSTLLSGCLSELDSTCVMSESPVLTEILLDSNLSSAMQQQYLQQLIDLQANLFPSRPHVIIKWNAWDIFRWQLIRTMYPQVPVIFLVRNPVEILASHYRLAGRHMSGDPTLGQVHPIFINKREPVLSLLEFRIRVLFELLTAMQLIVNSDSIFQLDYRHINLNKLYEICAYFRTPVSQEEKERIKARLAFNSKSPMLRFNDDTTEKQNLFNTVDLAQIQQSLILKFNQLTENN